MNLGNNLFQARKKKGLSQEEVAEKLGGKPTDNFEMGDRRDTAGHQTVKKACSFVRDVLG